MYPVLPAEMTAGAAQMLIYLVTATAALLSFLLSARG
jgi:hypothetical protein